MCRFQRKGNFNLDDIRNLVNGGNGLFVGFSEDSLLKKLVRSPYVSADDTLYGFTLDGNCFSKPVLVVLKANPTPQFNHQNDTTACGYFILDQINGNRLSGNEVYSTGERGSGKIYKANDTLFQSEKSICTMLIQVARQKTVLIFCFQLLLMPDRIIPDQFARVIF